MCGVYPEKDEQKNRESPERGSAIAEEGERYAYDRSQSQHHADIDEQMEEEDAHHALAVDSSEPCVLAFCQYDQSQNQCHEQQDYRG